MGRSEEHTSELQSRLHLVCRLLLEKKKQNNRRSPVDLPPTLHGHRDSARAAAWVERVGRLPDWPCDPRADPPGGVCFFFLMIRRPPRSTPFPTRRSSDLGGVGSGVIIDAEGHIVTNNHVVTVGD